MLTRFNEGLLHPLIHAGHGYELGIPGMIAEGQSTLHCCHISGTNLLQTGLAQACVHEAPASRLIPASLFKDTPTKQPQVNATKSLLDILARFITDPETSLKGPMDPMGMFRKCVDLYHQRIVEHVEAWSPDLSTNEGLQKALEEIAFLVNLMYAVPGLVSKEEGGFNADFFA